MEETTAQDIMVTDLITIREDDTVENALKLLVNRKITGVPVVDSRDRMVGVISEYDLIRQISKAPDNSSEVFHKPIEFSRKVFALSPSSPLSQIVDCFLDAKFRRIPIVDSDQRLVGIITRRDLMRLYFFRAKLT